MDHHGLKRRRLSIPYLEDVLSSSPRGIKSVWFLKQAVLLDDPVGPIASEHYGLSNCLTPEDQSFLKGIYKQQFEYGDINPIHLHEEATQGDILHWLERAGVDMEGEERERIARLTTNRSQ